MNKCFITKLPSSVDNDNLPVLGQLRINWLKQSNLTNNDDRKVTLRTTSSITVKVSGAHFTDSTLTSNLGNTKTITTTADLVSLYISNDADAVLTIDNKYTLVDLTFNNSSDVKPIYFDIEDIKYCTAIFWLDLGNTQVTGDISAVSKFTKANNIRLSNTQVTGDISTLSTLTNTSNIFLSNTQVTGDISTLSTLTNIVNLEFSNTQVTGDISVLANLPKFISWQNLKYTSLTGNMSSVPPTAKFISQLGRNIDTNFTWTANGRQNATLLAMEGQIPFDTASMDNMFIDQATCTVSPTATNPWDKIISVKGTRTSASDAAVAAIQNKGITITGVTKQA